MAFFSDKIDGVREVTPEVGARLEAEGRIKDFGRDNLIVHVGKPVGSITGWVGPLFWQVWVDRATAPGTVLSRIGQGEVETLALDATLTKAALLDAAKDRTIAAAQALRTREMAAAQSELAALPA